MSINKTNASGHTTPATGADLPFTPADADQWGAGVDTVPEALDELGEETAVYTSGLVTLANNATTTITHGDLGDIPPIVSAVKLTSSTPTQTILLHLNGSNGSTTIVDTGLNAGSHSWSVSGQTQIKTDQSKFNGSSLYFDGTGDSLRLAASADMLFSGPFTISQWVRFTAINAINVIFAPSDTTNNFQLAVYSGGRIDLYAGSTQVCTSASGVITTGTFHHIAVTRNDSNVCKIWVDGVEVASGTRSGNLGRSDSQFNIGMYADGQYAINAHMNEWAVNTTCLFTDTFTPPSAPYSDSEVVNEHLALGIDFSATTGTGGTTIRNISGATYDARFALRR